MNNFWKRKVCLGPELVVNVEENYLKLKWGPGITCGNIVGGEVAGTCGSKTTTLQQNVKRYMRKARVTGGSKYDSLKDRPRRRCLP